MDSHRTHGGVQNVTLFLLRTILKDGTAARQAVANGAITRASWFTWFNKRKQNGNKQRYNLEGGYEERFL